MRKSEDQSLWGAQAESFVVFRSIQAATAAQIEWSRRVEGIDVRREEGVEVKETADQSEVAKGEKWCGVSIDLAHSQSKVDAMFQYS